MYFIVGILLPETYWYLLRIRSKYLILACPEPWVLVKTTTKPTLTSTLNYRLPGVLRNVSTIWSSLLPRMCGPLEWLSGKCLAMVFNHGLLLLVNRFSKPSMNLVTNAWNRLKLALKIIIMLCSNVGSTNLTIDLGLPFFKSSIIIRCFCY